MFLQEKRMPSFPGTLKIPSWLTQGKKRGPQDQLGPFVVLKVIKPPEGNSCCGGTGRKKPPYASAEGDMVCIQAGFKRHLRMAVMRKPQLSRRGDR